MIRTCGSGSIYVVLSLERTQEVKYSISSLNIILLLKRKLIVDRSLLKDNETLLVPEISPRLV